MSYAAPFKVTIRLVAWDDTDGTRSLRDMKEQEVYFGEIPIMTENGFVTEVDSPIFGPHPRLAPLAKLSLTPGLVRPGVVIGQHTDKVLRELGFSEDALVDLEASRIIVRGNAPQTHDGRA